MFENVDIDRLRKISDNEDVDGELAKITQHILGGRGYLKYKLKYLSLKKKNVASLRR